MANLGSARRVRNKQGTWLVAPMTLIVPGVLDGSKGPLYYPPEEIARNYRDWDGYPITRNHPTTNKGEPASAFDRGILDKVGMGVVRNPRIVDNKLVADGWFHEARTKAVDKAIWNALESGKQLELSTGLGTVNEDKAGTCPHSNRTYNAVARDYQPDHVAVLTDGQLGACSISDGCGVNNSSRKQLVQQWLDGFTRNKGTTMDRDQAIAHLTTNCNCWKGKKDVLANTQMFTDAQVIELATNHKNAVLLANSLRDISEAVGAPKTLTINELPAFIKEKVEEKEEDKPEGEEIAMNEEPCPECGGMGGECTCEKKKEAPAMNRKRGSKSTEQWLAEAPPEAREMLTNMMNDNKRVKAELITKLIANAKGNTAATLRKAYSRNTIAELQAMLGAKKVTNKQENSDPLTLYFGAGGGVDDIQQVDNSNANDGVEFSGAWPATA